MADSAKVLGQGRFSAVRFVFTGVFAFGAALSGLAGVIAGPLLTTYPGMAGEILIDAFVVIVVGGFGSLGGAVGASLLIGELQSFGVLLFPKLSLALVYMLMAAVLIIKPSGLGGKAMISQKKAPYLVVAALFALGVLMPFTIKKYHLNMLTEIIVFALYAVSYNLLLGYAGLLCFGHAMFFGMGAFTVAVALIHIPGLSMWNAVLMALMMTTAVGFVFSKFEVRIEKNRLAGTAWGEHLDRERHHAHVEVKGATYHMLSVRQEEGRFVAQCVVDV